MILRISGRGTGCIVAEGGLLGRDSNRDPDYRANSIRSDNNNNIRSNEDINNVVTRFDLGDSYLRNSPQDRVLSTATKGLYNCIVAPGSPQDRVLSTATKGLYNCIVAPGSSYKWSSIKCGLSYNM